MGIICRMFGHAMFFDTMDVCGPSTCKFCGHKESGIKWDRSAPPMPTVKPPKTEPVLIMTHLERLTRTFDEIGINYTVRERDEYSYVFVGECRCIHNLDLDFKTGPLDTLTAISKFYEFEDGELATYSNS